MNRRTRLHGSRRRKLGDAQMATFVLVHGAWGGGLIWRSNARALRRFGHEVYTPTLTGMGERRHLLTRAVDLSAHVRDVTSLIDYEDLREIVLVGHSYGGMVVTGVADSLPDRIASLVYLDAFVPRDGQALFDLIPNGVPRPAAVTGSDWLTAPLPPEVFGAVNEAIADFTLRKSGPQPTACFTEALRITGAVERIRHRTYIYCNEPHPTTFTHFYEALRARPDWNVRTLACGHIAQLDRPDELTALLTQAIPERAT